MAIVDFGRLLTAMVTPFNADLTINLTQAQRLGKYLVENGSDGLIVCGTTGESPTLGKEEKAALFAAIVEEVGGRAAVVAGTGSYDTVSSIALTKEAEKVGCDGVMLVAPYYNKPSQEGLYRHFRAIAESTSLPVILYNIPGRTGINVLPDTVARLAGDVPNIVAIKEAAGNIDQVSELRRILPEEFSIYSGDDSMTLPMLALGAKGVISVAGHVAGKQIKEMIDAFTTGNTTLAANLHRKLFPLFKGLFITANPVPVKAALNLKGFGVGGVRLPLVEATPNEVETVKNIMTSLELL
ncbi:4-hydroxy-tetrahydrodipicolinate synthase [Desulforamulus ruminis]|uniref:4-hydroxy-tetrahydrodipicolinate synthase n=1 Tax=Desulforamulus ruminis (strain ATCC 23193 / DSM 2154 / NCIMB 8452 / DL) TaxID=696281 RepID=F6DUP0_DESRL|nr:4-hydroxy-tetrahydrodipicolinate synthase [Desulforamulus ruminis]AEG60178.1 dihydrodipicolinate synthase [Desulforamulus ruminis DSM 2154]